MSVEPSQVYIYCGARSVCGHSDPVIETPETHTNFAYDEWSLVGSKEGTMAKKIAEIVGCTSVVLLSSLVKKCQDSNCLNEYHCIDAYTSDDIGMVQSDLLRNKYLCNHMGSPFVRMAMEQNDVVISNDPYADVRFNKSRCDKSMPLTVETLMVVPLFVSGNSTHIGVIICANKLEPGQCNGFSPNDYSSRYYFFHDLAVNIMVRSSGDRIDELEKALIVVRKEHKEELSRVTLNTNSFIATMSHEIRTPLNAINGYNEIMLANSGDEPRYGKWLRKQRDATLTLTQLIANILDFAKLKTDSVTLNANTFNLTASIKRAIDLCSQEGSLKKIKTSMSVTGVPDRLVGDEGRISQVLRNLIMNAVKYTPPHGYIVVKAVGTRVENGLVELRVSVEDSGKGVPMNLQTDIFHEFRQLRDSMSPTAASTQGVGLGLAICREIVNLMNGKIWVDSDGRSGSTFIFTIQVRDQNSMDLMLKAAKKKMKDGAVLVVDDKEVNRILLTRMFFQWEMRPHACSSIEEALLILESHPNDYFYIAVIDIELSDESGVSLARRIANDVTFGHMALIAASSMGASFEGSDVFDAVHTKPIIKDRLLDDITRLLHDGVVRTQSLLKTVGDNSPRTLRRSEGYILIVDDDESCVVICEELLDQLGFKLHESARNAMDALRMMVAAPARYCIVLMDVLMPQIDGIQCTHQIRSDPARYGTPTIIALSADATEKTKTAMINIGAKEFISKPVMMDELRRTLERHYIRPYKSASPTKRLRAKSTKKKRKR
jgi:signal transduction histidine kinase/DNA-binding response OmpR family regulator